MQWRDEKIIAIVSLMVLGVVVVWVTKTEGLHIITNIVCCVGGLVTGARVRKTDKANKQQNGELGK